MGCCNPNKINKIEPEIDNLNEVQPFIETGKNYEEAIIKIQSRIRGIITREKIKKIRCESNNDNDLRSDTNQTKIEDFEFENLTKEYKPLDLDNKNNKLTIVKNIQNDMKELYYGEYDLETNKKEGRGIQLWKDGTKYLGYFVNDKANIKGKLIHINGDIYEGEWKDDKAEGQGTYQHIEGAKYVGEWKNDKQDGFGKEIWPDGSSYEGFYKSGKKTGKGVFKWIDGSSYNGEFKDNSINGNGIYIWNNQRSYNGSWVNNKMEGYGIFSWPDKRRYEGYYINDKKEGYGIFYWPDGRIFKGNWKNGKQEGEGEFFSPSTNETKKGIWEDGKRIKWIKT